VLYTAPSAPHTRPTQRLSRPPPIQKLGAENHMLQPNIKCSWWWAYVPETCRAKNTLIKLPCCIKMAVQIISRHGVCERCVSTEYWRIHPATTFQFLSIWRWNISNYLFLSADTISVDKVIVNFSFVSVNTLAAQMKCRPRWQRGLRRVTAAARLLGLGVRFPLGAWMAVS